MTRRTVQFLKEAKSEGRRITMLTAYDATMARLLDREVDLLLVGDSLGMVVLGYDSTLQVTMDDMARHTGAVVRGSEQALVVADLPFLSYHASIDEAVHNAGRLAREGAGMVKLEGGQDMCDCVAAIVRAQIPVMGHLGLTPQSVNALGGYRVQAKDKESAQELLDDARALQSAGASALVLECVPAPLATLVTEQLQIPTIGIGAGAGTDGQVLVAQDMLGLYDRISPRFVERFGQLGEATVEATRAYCEAVRSGAFPDAAHSFSASDDLLSGLY